MTFTEFHSWMGNATASNPFPNEYGTGVFMGLTATYTGSGIQYATVADLLAALTFTGSASPDPAAASALGFNVAAGGFTGLNPAEYASTSNVGGVTSFTYAGVGNGFAVTDANSVTFGGNQNAINAELAGVGPFTYTGTYTLGNSTGSGSVTAVTPTVPEPASLTLMGIGIATLVWRQRRRLLKKA
jgi:hypothetical protein